MAPSSTKALFQASTGKQQGNFFSFINNGNSNTFSQINSSNSVSNQSSRPNWLGNIKQLPLPTKGPKASFGY